jgi:hypothetical protein
MSLSPLCWILVGLTVAPAAAQHASAADSLSAHEQGRREIVDYFVGGRLGYLEVEDVDEGSPIIGVTGGYHFHPSVAIVGALEYHNADYSRENRWTVSLTAGLEVYPLGRRYPVQPYVTGGAGVYTSRVERYSESDDLVLDDTESDGGYYAGGGLDITWGDGAVALSFESRWIFTSEERDTMEVRPDGVQYTAGVRWNF